MAPRALPAVAAAAVAAPAAAPPPATILTVLIDDLGFADTQVHNKDTPTPHIGALAADGVVLEQHHAYRYCSPTRRSILSGRFPVHITGTQAPTCSNLLPLQMILLPRKLQSQGYATHMIGKGHLGYQTTDHLPAHRGFDTHVGYLGGGESYEQGYASSCSLKVNANLPPSRYMSPWPPTGPADWEHCHFDFWENSTQADAARRGIGYSTSFYAARAVRIIRGTPRARPLYIHLTWQAVHSPYTPPPGEQALAPSDPSYPDFCVPGPPTPQQHMRCDFGGMLKALDDGMRNVTEALKEQQRWGDALLVVSSDNGGIGPGNNYPLRGSKMQAWQGGTRVAAFVAGGYVPPALRGTANSAAMHVADWYPTLSKLAGADPADTVQLGGRARPIDGVDVWPLLLSGANESAREYLPTTEHSIIWRGRWKLLTNAQKAMWYPPSRGPNSTIFPASPHEWPCVAPTNEFLCTRPKTNGTFPKGCPCAVCSDAQPCLFDIIGDPSERTNVAATNPDIVARLAKAMAGYTPYVTEYMSEAELEGYQCIATPTRSPLPHPWWGNFTGPCCRPAVPTPAPLCADIPHPCKSKPNCTCEQHKEWGHCAEPWMAGYCCNTCFNCSSGCGKL